jgi:hypothetical protein
MFVTLNTAHSVVKRLELNMKQNRNEFKMSKEDVQGLLTFRKRAHKIRTKKGKGYEYNREDFRKETREVNIEEE